MDVTVEDFVATSAKDGVTQVHPALWRVRVDGRHAGFIARQGDTIKPGSKLLLHLRFEPDDLADIERQISEHFSGQVKAKQPAEPPEGFYESQDEELQDDDLE